jgi:hypothetical protein
MASLGAEPGTDTGCPPPAASAGKERRTRADLVIDNRSITAAQIMDSDVESRSIVIESITI